ncbi:acetyltransferase [Xenorhabdus beddingii]|uniref:Acetyltransferase n=1 Tax=Xenorhabdus beddingii TaxID=40578 RepID=A0A1Y2SRZ1_9GAMM|nr:GNAT family N-acetyltransferase [Xenorhabdus beddingii]OTA21908.1 acetyltransferase [Xenorhabdus beddingii]
MNAVAERSKEEIQIKTATLTEWLDVVEMARQEKWNPGFGDEYLFFNIDNKGFFISYLQGQPIASMAVVNFNENYASIGYYIVKPEFRGKGIGLALWKFAIKHAGERIIALDAVPEQEKNYSKWGFKTHYHTLRIQGRASSNSINKVNTPNINIVDQSSIQSVIEFDTSIIGYPRDRLLTSWFFGNNRKGFIFSENQNIKGLIGLRQSNDGYRIGPFYAKDKEHIKALFLTAIREIPEDALVTLDVPEYAQTTINLLDSFGFQTLFHTCKMYRGTPRIDYEQGNNAQASLELG